MLIQKSDSEMKEEQQLKRETQAPPPQPPVCTDALKNPSTR